LTLDTTTDAPLDQRTLAASLVPSLNEALDDRLSEVTWFKADWQRGGAATGTAALTLDDGTVTPVVLKLPVVERERRWMTRLNAPDEVDPPTPRVFGSGDSIAGYDLAWLVMERFTHGPLGLHWHEDHVKRTAEAAARFHQAAVAFPVDRGPNVEPWDELVAESLESVRVNQLQDDREWIAALKALKPRLNELVTEWRARDVKQWLHGDLHLANAMSRHSSDAGSVTLIDLAEVHAGHWLEDAVYLERQLWARPERLAVAKPVRAVAAARRKRGLPVEEDYPRLAAIRRLLLAASAPKFIKSEGHPAHLAACLEHLARALTELK